MNHTSKPNKLIHSTSPYLKQHAYNPVQWNPWGNEALQRAIEEDKPLIISIGYSACHWCHVMEHESFENEEIANVMNEGFVCIKVDREEHPDVDQLYMEAVQIMGINGGWPLNVFAMPDQRPFYGGTYFQPRQWLHILTSIRQAFLEKRDDLEESAGAFAKSLSITDTEKYGFLDHGLSANLDELKQMASAMKSHFDRKEGGLTRAPKFPNPSIWKFLLVANSKINDQEIHDQVMLTLHKMAGGGIYDQIGGGFARYSVDDRWFAPHFEKMLYDNAQLISLYAMAYQVEKNERFKEIVYESIDFIKRELTSPDHGFYSALDADSEGEEGNFYIWRAEELDELLKEDAELVMNFYNVESLGNWERGTNILYTRKTPEEFAEMHGMKANAFKTKLDNAKSTLLSKRAIRERPGLDDKILTSWNALMLKGLIDAFHAFGESSFLESAEKNASFIHENLFVEGSLIRSHSDGTDVIMGFLDDYAFTIDGFLALYQANFERNWLDLAIELAEYAIAHFYDPQEELFFYNDDRAEQLIVRKKEIFDNVIPASNSVMAQVLFFLGQLTANSTYLEISQNMLSKIAPMIKQEPQYLTNWGTLYAFRSWPTAEIAIVGADYRSFSHGFQKHFIPNKVLSADQDSSALPLLQNRVATKGQTTIYVCFDKSCKLPVHSIEEALQQLENRN